MSSLLELPPDLPVPEDDGAADHLVALPRRTLTLPSTTGETVTLDDLGSGRTILFVYPMTGQPGAELPEGSDADPGARGCTSEACDFGDRHADLLDAGRPACLGSPRATSTTSGRPRLGSDCRTRCCPTLTCNWRSGQVFPRSKRGNLRLFKRLTVVIRDGVDRARVLPGFPRQTSTPARCWRGCARIRPTSFAESAVLVAQRDAEHHKWRLVDACPRCAHPRVSLTSVG